MESVVVAALYKFVTLEDYHEFREPLLDACITAGVRGTLLLAREGINGTIAGLPTDVDHVIAYLRSDSRLADLEYKESCDDHVPFYRMKVKLKKEIVTMGVTGVDPNTRAGTYVRPRDWNDLVSDPEVLLIDTRNDYEVKLVVLVVLLIRVLKTFENSPILFARILILTSIKKLRCSVLGEFAVKKPLPSCLMKASRRCITCKAVF